MELSYDYLETDRTGNADRRDDEHFQEKTLRYRADWLVSDRQKLTFSYEHAENKQEYQGAARGFETTRDLLTAEHLLDFGPDGRHSLRTLMNWQEESGDFARIAEFVDSPAFSDRQVEAGKKYRYAVAALDITGNESSRSSIVEVTAP